MLRLLAAAWHVHYRAQREHRLAISGIYGRMRHPQYVALVLIRFGFLLQWPTILMVMAGCVRGHLFVSTTELATSIGAR